LCKLFPGRVTDLILIFSLDKVYGQIRSGLWTGEAWVSKFENIDDIKIIGNKFYSNKSNGEFVRYDNGKEKIKGLKIYKTWSDIPSGGQGQYEIGLKQDTRDDLYQGKFRQASFRLLDKEELEKMNEADLKIMRNEIYARYHLKFTADGQMESYFKKEGWYRGHYDNVDNFLTGLEKENIRLIKEVESK
jgi:hypothetical protein